MKNKPQTAENQPQIAENQTRTTTSNRQLTILLLKLKYQAIRAWIASTAQNSIVCIAQKSHPGLHQYVF